MPLEPDVSPAPAPTQIDTRFFGHPRGLSILFFTEMWERFSFYGMRALLIYYMTDRGGGLAFPVTKAGLIYGLYASSVYLLSLPGGWVADRLVGARRAVFYGGILIAAGEFCLAATGIASFYTGLLLIVLGTGLLKPNVSTIVGMLYGPGDHRRDAGFSIFYMGINLGAFLSPLVCGWLGQKINWHLGFAAAGVAMALGVVQYVLWGHYLGDAGRHPTHPVRSRGGIAWIILACVVIVGLAVAAVQIWRVEFTAEFISNAFGVALLAIAVGMFAWMILGPGWSPLERKRSLAIMVLFAGSCVFWMAYEQAGSTLSLFAIRNTRDVLLGFHFPASWFQSLPAIFVILLAPVFAWLWIALGKHEPSSPVKFAVALVFVGLGFLILVPAAMMAGDTGKVSPLWLTITYLLHTIGELMLSPVGLSAMTKLAPIRAVSLIMGLWFLSLSIGDYLSGRAASLYTSLPVPTLFGAVAGFAFAAAVVMFVLVKPTVRLMSGVK